MNVGGRLYVEKVAMVRQDEETKLKNIVFENGGCEIDLVLKAELLRELRDKIIESQDYETQVEQFEEWLSRKRGEYGKNGAGFYLYVDADQEKCSIDLETETDAEGIFPVWISIRSSNGKCLTLGLNVDQAKQIKSELEKFIAAEEDFSRTKESSLQETTV
jgi:hypothetical protein